MPKNSVRNLDAANKSRHVDIGAAATYLDAADKPWHADCEMVSDYLMGNDMVAARRRVCEQQDVLYAIFMSI